MEDESRSAAHRRAKQVEALGNELIDLPPTRLEAAPLPSELREAVAAAGKMSRTALRRQKLYIARLLRSLGDELEAVFAFMGQGGQPTPEETRRTALLESWRTRLLSEGEPAVAEFLELHPNADRQRLRQFVRAAAKESEQGKPALTARKLFVYLRELLAADEAGDTESDAE